LYYLTGADVLNELINDSTMAGETTRRGQVIVPNCLMPETSGRDQNLDHGADCAAGRRLLVPRVLRKAYGLPRSTPSQPIRSFHPRIAPRGLRLSARRHRRLPSSLNILGLCNRAPIDLGSRCRRSTASCMTTVIGMTGLTLTCTHCQCAS
jgi:hypothetical protein